MIGARWLSAFVIASLLLSEPARADDVELAREHFKRGVELFQAGQHAQALAEFETADRAHHDPAISYNIGRVRESLGHAQAAVDAYEAYLAEAGAQAEFSAAATLAIAEIKGRSTRVRIESTPPGARVRVDGAELSERTPVSVLLFRGKHTIEVDKDGSRQTRQLEVAGDGSNSELAIALPTSRPDKAPSPPPALAKPSAPQADAGSRPAPAPALVLDGLMGSAALSLSAYTFIGEAEETEQQAETSSDATAKGVVFGLAFDVGWALGDRVGLLLRGFGGLGSAKNELAALGAGGPALSYRLNDDWWIGAGVIFGGSRAESDATKTDRPIGSLTTEESSSSITYRTDFAMGPSLEVSYALTQTENGQWLVSLIPGMLLTTEREQSSVFIPLLVGYRWF